MNRIFLATVALGAMACSSDYKVGSAASSYTISPDLNDLGVISVGETQIFTVLTSHTGRGEIDVIAAGVIKIGRAHV